MALYTERTYEDLLRDQLAQQQAEQAKAMQAYNAQKNRVDQKYSGGLGGFLGDIVGGVGKFFGDIGQGVGGLIGTGVASAKDLIESAAEGKFTDRNTRDFKKDWYKAENDKDAAAKAAGTSLNAATNVASFIPGVGAGTAAGKVAGGVAANTAMGALGGFGDEFQQQGQDAQIDSAVNRALAGGAAGLATGGLNRKLGNATSKVGSALLNNKVATSTLGRGALSGAVGGAVGAGTSAALGGGDVAQAALQGGLTGAAGGATQAGLMAGASKLGQKALGKINRNNLATSEPEITQNVTEDEFRAYGDSALAKKTKRNQVSDALSRFGDTLEGAQTNVTRAAARDLGVDSTGKVVENVRKKTGLTNLDTQAALAKELTGGADSLMDKVQRQALTATEDGKPFRVDTTSVERDIKSIVNSIADDNILDTKKTIQNLQRTVGNNDSDIMSISNRLKASASDLRGKGITDPTPKDSALSRIYSEVANRLDKLSYDAIPKSNVNDMFDVTISEMKSRANQANASGNKQIANAYNKLADKLNQEPRTIQAYRSFKKDFVDISKIDQLTGRAENGAAQNLGQSASGVVKKIGNNLLNRPINSALAKAGGAVNSVADAISNIAPTNSTQTSTQTNTQTAPLSQNTQTMLGNIIGRTTGQMQASNAVQNARKAQEYQNLEDMLSNIQSTSQGLSGAQMGNMPGNTLGLSSMAQTSQANQFGAQLADIANGMQLALTAGDIDSYQKLADLYSTVYKLSGLGTTENTTSNMTTSEKNQLAKLQSANTALDQLEQLYQKAGGGQGIIGGNIANFLGGLGLNSDVSTYNQLAQGLINQIGAAIGKTDSLNTEGEVQRALSLVPKITDDNQTAMNKLATLRALLQENTGTYNQLYGA